MRYVPARRPARRPARVEGAEFARQAYLRSPRNAACPLTLIGVGVRPPVADAEPDRQRPTGLTGIERSMDPQMAPGGVDGLVILAVSQAVADSLSRRRRRRLVAKLLAIAADWEREDNVLALTPPAAGEPALRAAALRLRSTARLLAWSPLEP